jgi:CRP/FNR family transcriptional regulator, cyclic AMP receptor protein
VASEHQPQQGYWDGLTAAERTALTDVASRSTLSAGSVVLAAHDTTRDVVLVRSGYAKVVARAAAGGQVVLAVRGPGDLLGEMAHISGGRRSAAVVAINEVVAYRVPAEEFGSFLDGYANASHLLQRTLVDRLLEADSDRIAASSMTIGQRLARLLLNLAQRYGVPGPGGDLTIALLSQTELAACVGAARRTVARQIGQWRKRHVLSTTRLTITIHEPQSLSRLLHRHDRGPVVS